MYENKTMKPVKTALRRGRDKIRENDGGVSLIKIHCKVLEVWLKQYSTCLASVNL
jgi:hypothetical protein